MNWKPGDRALIVRNEAGYVPLYCQRYLNETCVLLNRINKPKHLDWAVDCLGKIVWVSEKVLRPIPDDNETTTWEAVEDICGWNPMPVEIPANGDTGAKQS